MCLIVFSFQNHEKYPLILAGNRDEFYKRPTKQAEFWEEKPDILAGKDLEKGGTWLGVNRGGNFAFLTNYRDINNIKDNADSRGDIVISYLESNLNVTQFIRDLDQNALNYNGFNLLAGNVNQLFHYSNKTRQYAEVKPGIHGISNALLNTSWPKTDFAKTEFSKIIADSDPDVDALFRLLQNRKRYPPELLPETGLSEKMEIAVSSAFIETEDYGTRCSTLLFIDNAGKVTFIEKTHQPKPDGDDTVKYVFESNLKFKGSS